MLRVHRIPRSTSGDDWPNAPLHRGGTLRIKPLIWGERQVNLRKSELRQIGMTGNLRMAGMRMFALRASGKSVIVIAINLMGHGSAAHRFFC
jgi:hypothetical protein